MMVALLWYKVTDCIVQRLCIKQCQQGECHLDSNYDAILREIQKLKGFVNILPVYDKNMRATILSNASGQTENLFKRRCSDISC